MKLFQLTTTAIAIAFLTAAAPALAQGGTPGPKDKPGVTQPGKPGKPGKPGPQQAAPGKPGAQQAAPGKPGPQQAAPGKPGAPGHGKHDRYWKPGFSGGYVAHDRVFGELRRHHYQRFDGKPFFRDGRYVVRSWRDGRVVFIEINPYTGEFIGEIRF